MVNPEEEMLEIERRFLVPLDVAIKQAAKKKPAIIEQSYLMQTGKWQIRTRKRIEKNKIDYTLTMKRRVKLGTSIEIEETSSKAMHESIVALTGKVLVKQRTHHQLATGQVLELDIFRDEDLVPGYAIAEIEVISLDEEVALPDWLGEEITGAPGYSNAKLFKKIIERC